MERITTLTNQGRTTVILDFTGLAPPEVIRVIDSAATQIRRHPPKSVDTVTCVEGTSFNSDIIAALKKFAKGNDPHVRSAAIVGLSGMQRIVLSAVSHFTGRSFSLCATVDEALEQLASPS